jgi:DNA-binding SARP family transcriptional activator
MQFGVLGSLLVERDGVPVELGGARPRRLLAALLVHANELVSEDRLIEAVWGSEGPSTGARALQVIVSRLRGALDPERREGGQGCLVKRRPGYVLVVDPADLDAARFECLLAEARARLAKGDPLAAAAAVDAALAR